jgi:hypothetical protein
VDPTGNSAIYLVDGMPVEESNVHYLTAHGNVGNVSYAGNLKEEGIYSGMSYFKHTGQLFNAQQAYEFKQGFNNGTITYSDSRSQFGTWNNKDGRVVFITDQNGERVKIYETISEWVPFGQLCKGFGNNENSLAAQGGGGTDWGAVGNGAMTFAGGAMATVGGVAAGLTGVGTPLGVSLAISTGIPTMGLGTAMMINGFRGVNKNLPGGVAETVDRGMGGSGTTGQLIDIGIGGFPKTLGEALMSGYGLINSNFGQMLLSPSPSGNYNYNSFAPIDNTRVVLPYIR